MMLYKVLQGVGKKKLNKMNVRRQLATVSLNNAVHTLCNKIAKKAKDKQAGSDAPEPVQVFNVLARNETYHLSVGRNKNE
jgi:hypothetical protein